MVSRTSKYNNRVKQLEATAAQLQVSAEQVSLETAQQGEYQLILADGVCQQMALYDVLVPTQQQWLAVEPCTAQQQEPWGSDTKRVTISPGLSSVVELVEKCNPMLKAVFNVSVATIPAGVVTVTTLQQQQSLGGWETVRRGSSSSSRMTVCGFCCCTFILS